MSLINPSILPGFMELLPEEQVYFENLKNIIEKNFIKYGFVKLDTPIIEKEEILLSKGGGETSKQIYRIDKESTPQALRYDLTVSLARYVSMYSNDLSFPFKRYQIGKVYRGERNQKGRYREFYQCDVDIVGNQKLSLKNDGEIPSVVYKIFEELGFKDIVVIRLNNRKLLNGYLEYLGIKNYEETLRIIDKIEKIGKDKTLLELKKLEIDYEATDKIFEFIQKKDSNEDTIKKINEFDIDNEKFIEGKNELFEVYKYMKLFDIPEENIKIDLSITRGLDYYTSTVFETFLRGYEDIGSVCSGGRYDDLATNFSKQRYPGIGLSIGLTRLFYQLNEAGLLNKELKENNGVLVIPMDETVLDYAIDITNELRKNNLTSQIYLEQGKIKKKFSYADKLGVKNVIIIGEKEKEENSVSIRDFKSGKQKLISKDEIINYLDGGYND